MPCKFPALWNAARMRKPSNLIPCDADHLRYLAQHARPDEIEQFLYFTERNVYLPDDMAQTCIEWASQGPCFTVLGADGMPAASGGYIWRGDGVWNSWMIGSMRGWENNWRALTKAVRWLIDAMFQVGAKRLETYVLPTRTRAIEWYERGLGLTREADDLYVRAA